MVISARADMQEGVFLYGIEITAANNLRGAVRNFSGVAMVQIDDLPVCTSSPSTEVGVCF